MRLKTPINKKQANSYNLFWPILGLCLGLGLIAFFYFTYILLPEKIADKIMLQSKVRAPLTETPQDKGYSYRNVSFPTSNGVTISGWWMPPVHRREPLGTILLSHGVFHNRDQVLNRAGFLVKDGYQVLLFDLQGEGLSGPSPISGGPLEAQDYLAAVRFLKEHHQLVKPIIFFGFSLGAISAIRAAPLCPEVGAVIADSPMPNVKSYVSRRSSGGYLTILPGFFNCCLNDYDRLTGLSLKPSDLDLKPIVQHFNEIPILYITGENDDLARPSEVRKLFNETQTDHRSLVYIPDAGHEQTFTMYPMIYEQAVKNFLNEVRAKFPEPSEADLLSKIKSESTSDIK